VRKVVSGLFISLDGVTEAPDQWQFDHFDAGMGEFMTAMLDAQDAILLGRVTWQEWAGYWPTSTDEPFASYLNGIPKYVVSKTLTDVGAWQNSTLLNGDLAEEIGKLKQQDGKNIGVAGSPKLVRSLLQADLLDELQLAVHPVIAGSGKRLFGDADPLKRMKLVDSKATETGNLLLKYQPREA
jgi:dihydrofolate reductase